MDRVGRYIVLFIVLVLLQLLIFSNINYLGFVCPYVYILFMLTLPFGFNKYASMGLAFLLGFIIDMFSNTPGVHIAATVAVAFVRDYWMYWVLPHTDVERVEPSLKKLGMSNYLRYAVGLVLFHHLILFFAEAWSFAGAWFTILKALVNTIITMLLIICYYLISKR